ncbi:MAG: hypothetical protein HY801_05305 [Candidatus Lindowbacteria bacterium]|nr:hypothetical protein [Candidatus Lindowbacteria bacterium]
MNKHKVVPLFNLRDIDKATAGLKAISLARMKRMGLPVPPGFCILGAASHEHLEINGHVPELKNNLENLKHAPPEERRSLLSRIRQNIIDAAISPPLSAEIREHYLQLAAAKVAVRSSATAEDMPGHSFAGLYDTYLGISALPNCLEAVKKCWASLWTERAYDYRTQNGFDHLSADMAVIVQELVTADSAGVIFTADPVSGRTDRIVIEACFGMGEALVSGRVTPDRFELAKKDMRVLSHSLSSSFPQRRESMNSKEKTGPSSAACIDETTARRLAELAKKVESCFGLPQDIEWAVKGEEIFLLQSRPITTLKPPRTQEDRQIWSNLNSGEVMPDVVTPISWSMVTRMVPLIFNSLLGGIGMDTGANPIMRQFGGRAYFNLNTMVAIFRCLPGMGKKDITQVFGGDQGRLAETGFVDLAEEDIPTLDFSFLRLITRIPGFMYRIAVFPWKRADRLIAEIEKKAVELRKIEANYPSEDEILKRVQTAMDDISYVATAVPFAGIGICFFAILEKLCQKWLGDQHGVIANRLLTAVGGMRSAESGLDLWNLAAKAHEHPEVERIIRSCPDWRTASKQLQSTREGAEFLSSWNDFMERHGHHTRGEIELANARWCETPDYIFKIVQGYLERLGDIDPIGNHKKAADERKNLEEMCLQRLRNPLKRAVFSFCMERARRGMLLRENFKNVAVRYLAGVHFVLLGVGERLASRGVLENRDDVFFLALEEVEPVSRGEAAFNVKEVVVARRAEHERNKTITPPKVVIGSFDPDDYVPHDPIASKENSELLTGVPVSAGVAVGLARVILKADTTEHVLPGEILVAPFTDPGWTPYFISAAAIVMDQGGLLSHGSIIARECGIPAVVNVGPATKLIKTGQTIEVNGNKGTVRILQ